MAQHDLTDPPPGSAAADVLMGVFGLRRVPADGDGGAAQEPTPEPPAAVPEAPELPRVPRPKMYPRGPFG